ncbi:hypothetical protein EGT74_04380 [Chitinophaga lutea]|uniref:Tetratricopeptide repeat protein n=1 Tax=Chitinophaga lutea TaxID=2488634 RepID=A0A3N4Q9T0_9BACT|nr:hypothetical protein [Chitinophaga lutea]RPE12787.1 hypothetical protein EGT74_04380 [Chitinophaga lutea]
MKSCFHILMMCIFIAVSSGSAAQNSLPDSLRSAISGAGQEEERKPALLNQLAEIYRINKDYASAESRARQSAVIALRLRRYTDAVKAYTLLTNIRINSQQYPNLKQVSDSALALAQQAKDPVAMAYGYYAQVLLYKMLDNGEEVVRFCNQGLKELERADDPYIAGKIYYQLYAVYAGWNNEARINIYARKATENALLTKDYNLLSNCLMAMSTAHEYNYNATKSAPQLDSTLLYLNRAGSLYQQYPGRVANYTYAIACVNLANYYLRYFPETDKAAEAQGIHYANTARAVLRGVPNCEEVVGSSLGILSEYASRAGNKAQAGEHLLEAWRVMKATPSPYYYTLINVVQALSQYYAAQGDYKKALEFQQAVTEYSNKNFNQKQALNAQKLDIQYETEKKNNEMQMLKEQERSRRLQNYLYGSIAAAAVLGLIFMFRAYHFSVRYAAQREKQLQLEKLESELQVKLEKEEQARLKAEQQLLETQQQQLKKEVMANVLQLEHKNQTLLNIKDKLAGGDPVNMQKILKEEMMLDGNFEQAKIQIQQVHPDFFFLLSERAQKKLTLLDLKLCAYFYLQMDTRQIAQLMHIEAKSVRMSRYRIKQKLGLDREDDLNSFLQGLGA